MLLTPPSTILNLKVDLVSYVIGCENSQNESNIPIEHNHRTERSVCKICVGSGICHHNSRKSQCKESVAGMGDMRV